MVVARKRRVGVSMRDGHVGDVIAAPEVDPAFHNAGICNHIAVRVIRTKHLPQSG